MVNVESQVSVMQIDEETQVIKIASVQRPIFLFKVQDSGINHSGYTILYSSLYNMV